MPYIDQRARKAIDPALRGVLALITTKKLEAGDINYLITRILLTYLEKNGYRYKDINEVMGILECVKQEFYRRVVAPYEEQRKKERGDVF